MAVIWQKHIAGRKYEVRSAGQTRRLYTNGVCHSEFNPNKMVTGSIWDLLVLPAFFYSQGQIRRVLMLGVGGGASILQLHHLLQPDCICGVELDSVHLDIARRFFNVSVTSSELYESDARDWLQQYKGAPFDMIIDDLFIDEGMEPVRAIDADTEWLGLILKHLSVEGHLVINFGSDEEFLASAYFNNHEINQRFLSAFKLTSPLLDNIVGAFMGINTESKILRENIIAHPVLGRALQSKRLRYRIRKMNDQR
ncbi:MAG: spermidine synthase [Planctomycetota bacterium]|jgi:spermidine synthase